MSERDDPKDEELAALYRDASTERPAAGLDARILAAARASGSVPRTATPSWTSRWRIPVALAATVLLTSTITLMVREHDADPSSMTEGMARDSTRVVQPVAPPKGEVAPVAPAAPAEAMRSPAPESAAQAVKPGQGPAARKAEAFVPDPARAIESPSRESKVMQTAPAAAAPAVAAPAAAAPAVAAPQADSMIRDQPALERSRSESRSETLAAPAAAAGRADSAAPASLPTTPGRSAEQWLTEIRRLLREGRTAEAAASLAAFRKRHPQYVLPEDLKQP